MVKALAPGLRSRVWTLALGWPIGLTLEILAFALTAALGVRDAFLAYPLAVGVPALLIHRARRRQNEDEGGEPEPMFSPAQRWTIAALVLVAFAFIGMAYYAGTPLPGTAPGAVIPGDTTFHISLAASALHGWPPSNFRLVGDPLHYHYFVHLHMAAAAQVTGVDLAVIVMRLHMLPLTAILILGLALAGRVLTGRAWAGPVTVVLFLFIRSIDLSISDPFAFAGLGIFHLWGSPSQLLGMVLFVPAVVALAALVDPVVAGRLPTALTERRSALWAVLFLILAGCGGAKSAILPLLVAGLGLYLVWTWLRARVVDRTALVALGMAAALFAIYYLLMYRGASQGLGFNPPATIKQMTPLVRMHSKWPDGVLGDATYWVAAVPVGAFMYFGAPLLGLALWWRRREESIAPSAALAVSLLAAGSVSFFFLFDDYGEQNYFTVFGLIAIMPLSALGLIEFLGPRLRAASDRRRWGLFIAAWGTAVVLIAFAADRLAVQAHFVRADALAYLPVLGALAVLAAAALVARGPRRALLGMAAATGLLVTAGLDAPLDVIPNVVRHVEDGTPVYQTSHVGLRPEAFRAMEWIRDNIPEDAVLAVSNDMTPQTFRLGPIDSDYPAFTEHRTFREAWAYTTRANNLGQQDVAAGRIDPYPERTALERAAFRHGDRRALRVMSRRYGVDYIVVSKKDGPVNRRLYSLCDLVFSNGAVDVLKLPQFSR